MKTKEKVCFFTRFFSYVKIEIRILKILNCFGIVLKVIKKKTLIVNNKYCRLNKKRQKLCKLKFCVFENSFFFYTKKGKFESNHYLFIFLEEI